MIASATTSRLKNANRHPRGFTLVEVLATVVLIAIVMPAVMQGIMVATTTADLARARSQATGLAQSKLNELIATTEWQQGVAQGDFGTDFPGFRWQLNRANWANDTTTVGLQQLDLVVTYTVRGREQTVTLSTIAYVRSTT